MVVGITELAKQYGIQRFSFFWKRATSLPEKETLQFITHSFFSGVSPIISESVTVGNRIIGGGAPVAVQSMTNTDTADANTTFAQILALAEAGAELVRITVDRPESAIAVPHIVERVRRTSLVPIIGDFHFSGHLLLEKFPDAARALDKYRVNPGNLGGKNRDRNFEKILEIAAKNEKPIRIGGNSGSVDREILARKMDENRGRSSAEIFREALVESVLESETFARKFLPAGKIILSAKCSHFADNIATNQALSAKSRAPLHLGLTEAGGGISGIIKSASTLAVLLASGIGDTIRVSITPTEGNPRTREVEVAREILQTVGARQFFPEIISCPGCGRANPDFSAFVENISAQFRNPKFLHRFPALAQMTIAIMGCIVNGPGEAERAEIGIFFPGRGEKRVVLFEKGIRKGECEANETFAEVEKILEKYRPNKRVETLIKE